MEPKRTSDVDSILSNYTKSIKVKLKRSFSFYEIVNLEWNWWFTFFYCWW